MLSSMLVRALVACRVGMRNGAITDYVISSHSLIAVQPERHLGAFELAPSHDGFMQSGSQNWRGKRYQVAVFASEIEAHSALNRIGSQIHEGGADRPTVKTRLAWLKDQERILGERLERLVPSRQHAA